MTQVTRKRENEREVETKYLGWDMYYLVKVAHPMTRRGRANQQELPAPLQSGPQTQTH